MVAGSAQRASYSNETLSKLNRIVDYFSLNESVVASVIDKQDATVSYSIVIFQAYICSSIYVSDFTWFTPLY